MSQGLGRGVDSRVFDDKTETHLLDSFSNNPLRSVDCEGLTVARVTTSVASVARSLLPRSTVELQLVLERAFV